VVKRNAGLLLAYSLLLGLIALLGYMAVAAGIQPSPVYKNNVALPALFAAMFPSWFAGFAFAAIAIGALVPAAIMSIASANLFTRNIYREYFRPTCTEREESNVAKAASSVVKVGALAFILFLPTTFAINFQLFSNVWIVQTLPAVFLGLYTNRFHRLALITGWAGGMIVGTGMVIAQNFNSSVYPLILGSVTIPIFAAVAGLAVNLILTLALTPFFRAIGIPAGQDATTPEDYEARPVLGLQEPAGEVGQSLPVFQPLNPDARQPIPSFRQSMPGPVPGFQQPATGTRGRIFQQTVPSTEQSVLEPRVGQFYKRQ
jgi:SSS family solute:Na+ symporter